MITILKDRKKKLRIKIDQNVDEVEVYLIKNTDTDEEGGWVTANVFIDDVSWVDPNRYVIV